MNENIKIILFDFFVFLRSCCHQICPWKFHFNRKNVQNVKRRKQRTIIGYKTLRREGKIGMENSHGQQKSVTAIIFVRFLIGKSKNIGMRKVGHCPRE